MKLVDGSECTCPELEGRWKPKAPKRVTEDAFTLDTLPDAEGVIRMAKKPFPGAAAPFTKKKAGKKGK